MFAPYGPGNAIRVLDEFSPYVVDLDPAAFFDHDLAQCFKGIEVDCERGAVHGDDLRHGIEQLRYLLPRLVTEEVGYAVTKPQDKAPFALCPILLTTAELRVLDKQISIERVSDADSLEELGTLVPFLLLYSDYGPDFAAHCTTVCKLLGTLPPQKFNVPDPGAQEESYTAASSEFERINGICRGLATADPGVLSRYFTQFVVCNHGAFPQLVDKVVGTTAQILGVAKARGDST
jgi:hypothetical protein